VLILAFAFIGGLIEGSVKSFFRLLGLVIAIPITGALYPFLASVLSFLPGENWENFISFIVILAILSTLLYLIFFIPRKFIEKISIDVGILRLIGSFINILNSAIGMVVFTLLIQVYPVMGWLEDVITQSSILSWLVMHLGFVKVLLPELFHIIPATVVNGSSLG
jgi:uncharacterized membrane protein required for colicin V production